MPRRTVGFVVLAWLLGFPVSAVAQGPEVGATLGTYSGGQVGVWLSPSVEATARLAWRRVPSHRGSAIYYQCEDRARGNCPVKILISNGTHRLVSGEVVYHFRPTEQMRPFVGVGLGNVHYKEGRSCEVVGCEPEFSTAFFRDRTRDEGEMFAVSGVSYAIGEHTLVRAGARLHNLIFEGNVVEVFASLGYRF